MQCKVHYKDNFAPAWEGINAFRRTIADMKNRPKAV